MEQVFNGAVVNAGCLLFFPEQQEVDQQNDVLDSLLYVQLAAVKKHRKFAEFHKWNETWLAAALRFGWVMKATEHVSESLPADETDTVWGWANRALAGLVPNDAIDHAERRVRKAWAQTPGKKAVRLLNSQVLAVSAAAHDPLEVGSESRQGKVTVALQIGYVGAHRNLGLAQLYFTTRQSLTSGFLFETLAPDEVCGNIELTCYSMRLMDQVYAQFREAFDVSLSARRAVLLKRFEGAADVQS